MNDAAEASPARAVADDVRRGAAWGRRDACAVLAIALLTLAIVWPWPAAPLTTGIGMLDAKTGTVTVDTQFNMWFGAWLRYAPEVLGELPLGHTRWLMWPVGCEPGRSFDGLLYATWTALLSGAMPLHAAHSLALTLGVLLCGLAMYALARHFWGPGGIATALGLCAAGSPFLMQRIAVHPNLIYIWPMPLQMLLFFRVVERPTPARAVVWGLGFALLALGTWYGLLMMSVFTACGIGAWILPTGMGTEQFKARWRTVWRPLAIGLSVGAMGVVAVGWSMLRYAGGRLDYPATYMAQHAPTVLNYLLPHPDSWLGQLGPLRAVHAWIGAQWEAQIGVPLAALSLFLVALMRGNWWPRDRTRMVVATTAVIAFIWSLGPWLQPLRAQTETPGLSMPLDWLSRLSPAFTFFRVPSRMSVLVFFCVLLGAGFALAALRAYGLRKSGGMGVWGWRMCIGGFVVINLACSVRLGDCAVFTPPAVPAFYAQLAQQPRLAEGGAILDLPYTPYGIAEYNMLQLVHRRPITSAMLFHDALAPDGERFFRRRPALRMLCDNNWKYVTDKNKRLVRDPELFEYLAERGVEYIIIHPRFYTMLVDRGSLDPQTQAILAEIEQVWRPRLVYADTLIRVYRTAPATGATTPVNGKQP